MSRPSFSRILIAGVFFLASQHATADSAGQAAAEKAVAHAEPAFAVVNGTTITQREYDEAFAMAARQKFYHGKPPEAELAALQREVGHNLVNSVLLAAEARKRGIKPDAAAVKQTLEGIEQRYGKSEQWLKQRASVLPELTRKLEADSLINRLQVAVRNVPVPSQDKVKAYYESHADKKFTEPEKVRIGVILLKVDPSSPNATWLKAEEEAKGMVKQLRAGGSFADMAKLRSGEGSAEKGGDMGYLHRGMLPEAAQEPIDKLKAGEISDPVRLLEGVAVFRLAERKPARRVSFAEAQERAAGLLQRELSEQAWNDLIEQVRKGASIRVDETRYLPLKAPAAPAGERK